jgi:lambda family phage portal protein
MTDTPETKTAETAPLAPSAMGGYEGARRVGQELASWGAPIASADSHITREKHQMDARALDMQRNDGYVVGAINIRRDSIVGSQYTLNAQPDYEALGADEAWAEEFQRVVESKFNLWAESPECWPDAARLNTLTGLVRLAITTHFTTGEVLATVEWLRSAAERRPFNTAIQMIDVDRLSNPNGMSDTKYLRGGVERNQYGAPLAYHIRMSHPYNAMMAVDADQFTWRRVAARKNWGRQQVIHIFEQNRPDQSRGVSDMVSVLKQMRMTKKFQDVVLQNAVLNATYAATIESELPPEVVAEALGAAGGDAENPYTRYMNLLAGFAGGSRGLQIDGTRIPHLFPGTKLNFKTAEAGTALGTGFEESLLRHISSALGLSYEQFSRDYTKTNYSSARASMLETWKAAQAIKKSVADRFASIIYALWLEEAINKGEIPLPGGAGPDFFYQGLNKEALIRCEWLGAARGQIDEKKETEAALMRIEGGLSTYEDEIGRSGKDFRRVFRQRAREDKLIEELGLQIGKKAEIAAAEKAAERAAAAKAENSDTDNEDDDL